MRRAILIEAGLPGEIADKIEEIIRDMWQREVVEPVDQKYMPVAAVKNILLPSFDGTYYIDLDRIIGGWDDTRYLRNMAVLYNHCRRMQKIVNDSRLRGPSPLVETIWEQKKIIISRKYLAYKFG